MPCTVGMTTDPERRRQEHEREKSGFRDWRILEEGLTRQEAQEKEKLYSQKLGCDSHPGGNDPDVPSQWSVYVFSHD